MADFKTFADAIHERFTAMSGSELYVVDAEGIWSAYLSAFPTGSNPMFRERTEHDCSTCRHFARNVGNVVEIADGQLRSVWGGLDLPEPYRTVSAALDEYVTSRPIVGIFRMSEPKYGTQQTRSLVGETVETWNHFHGEIVERHRSREVATVRGEFLASVQVFRRGLEELSGSAIDTVVDLIDNNSLYRGEEHMRAVTGFRSLLNHYNQLVGEARNTYVFANASNPAARFRNTVIGTLVQDLSEGMSLEAAVRSFEAKVAPANYKRPKALITPAMVADAMKTITALGIESSLERRFAHLADVGVNDVLWVNRDVRPQMKDGSIADILMAAATTAPRRDAAAEPISIADFMKNILPGATDVDLLVKNANEPNFCSITTGANPGSPSILKWGNDFAWSYGGNVTDSIKEKVKRAGGNVAGKLRVSLSWFNYDDLDIHVIEPNGNRIYYGNRQDKLDVDMNAGGRSSREPVENVSWTWNIQDGDYRVEVNNFAKRETVDVGFVIETESAGVIQNYRYDKAVRNNETVPVGVMAVEDGKIVKFAPGKDIIGGSASKDIWGVRTEDFVKVKAVMYSPNYWGDSEVGNRHYIFALDGCVNDQPTRGLYNEFLKADLDKHRKVFEVLGDRTKCAADPDQISGLGFSSTSGATITAKVTSGGRQRLLAIQF
ncbi:hypothetical protein [Kineosporia sp. NBRC 101731]|uniref:hypothetical protein n=1 Tax=Kineosporia sp. NBRC 101731 TaxID=3032199 RepID=UPI0024A4285B|nr:hypothetical protein [Kineosporia sp. NBRC 101731]GLY32028.1 hypothetical protein Kisp02_53930 [Kineosporia sp. NBRC 101731]